jgi:hypothetical protein
MRWCDSQAGGIVHRPVRQRTSAKRSMFLPVGIMLDRLSTWQAARASSITASRISIPVPRRDLSIVVPGFQVAVERRFF